MEPSMTTSVRRIISCGAVAAMSLAFVGLSIAAVQAKDYAVGSMQISQPWARATPKGASTGAAYMTIINNGTAADRVSCVSSDASDECQIHSMTMDNGVMKMRPVEGGLEIKPGQTVMLKPSGFHVMLVKLKHQLEQGQDIKLTLKFEHAGTVDVDYPIAGIGAAAPGVPAGNGSMMMGGPMAPMNKQ
jgi:hypothetical protein